MAVATLVVVAIGEIVQQPRYYDYISRLAPQGQQGTYMGFAFLPLGIGSFVAGKFSGWLMHHFGEEMHRPELVWWCGGRGWRSHDAAAVDLRPDRQGEMTSPQLDFAAQPLESFAPSK